MKRHANLTDIKAASRLFFPARHWMLHCILHCSALLLAALLFSNGATWAKSSDNNAPVHIEADQMEMREKEDISIYTGDVKITKGSIKITGDKIIIQNRKGRLYRIKIDGQPATFFQITDLNEEITAQSYKMDYNAQQGMLELKKKAILEKNKNRFSSEHILYDTLKDIVKAGRKNRPNSQGGSQNSAQPPPRVKITIHPEQPPAQQKSTEKKPPESDLRP